MNVFSHEKIGYSGGGGVEGSTVLIDFLNCESLHILVIFIIIITFMTFSI